MNNLLSELDFSNRMIEALESNVQLPSRIDIPIIKNDEGIAFMFTPVGPVKQKFYNGDMLQRCAFQLTMKSLDQELIINTFNAINAYVFSLNEGDIQSQNGSFKFNEATVSSTPVYLGQENSRYIYASNYEAELLIKTRG